MRVIDFLAGQLTREILPFEKDAGESNFSSNIHFWNMCLRAYELTRRFPLPTPKKDNKESKETTK